MMEVDKMADMVICADHKAELPKGAKDEVKQARRATS